MTEPVGPEAASEPHPGGGAERRHPDVSARTIGGWTLAAAVVDAVAVVSFLLFYAVEIGRPRPHVFGPLSDASSALFDLLLLPLLWFVLQRLPRRTPARGYALVSVVATAVGAVNSALLVLGLLNDAVSFVLTMVVIGVQAGWFVLVGRRGRETLGVNAGIARWALLAGLGMLVAIVVLIPAALLPPQSAVAIVLWIVGGAVGGIAWISWPIWLALVGRSLRRMQLTLVG